MGRVRMKIFCASLTLTLTLALALALALALTMILILFCFFIFVLPFHPMDQMHKIPSGPQTGTRDDSNLLENLLRKGLHQVKRLVDRAIVTHRQCPMRIVLVGQGFELLSDVGRTIACGHQEVNTRA